MSVARMRVALMAALAAGLALAGCSSGNQGETAGHAGRLHVVASFYPLQYVLERIGGADVTVSSLTKPGAEPHDLELTPRQVANLSDAGLVVYAHGFQPAVDDAADSLSAEQRLDVAPTAHLTLTAVGEEAQDSHAGGAATPDPHFWLDPVRYAAVAQVLGQRLAAADPAHKTAYEQRTTVLVGDLTALDSAFATGLADCRSRDLVTGHAAFGYLSQRYHFTQVPISGVSPDAEPNATEIRDVVRIVREHGVRTVYAETLVSPALTETVARETGATVKVLDPVEGITSKSQGTDYLQVMHANLATLRAGQECR